MLHVRELERETFAIVLLIIPCAHASLGRRETTGTESDLGWSENRAGDGDVAMRNHNTKT